MTRKAVEKGLGCRGMMGFNSLVVAVFAVLGLLSSCHSFTLHTNYAKGSFRNSLQRRQVALQMVMDDFIVQKLNNIKRTFNALTERLADPDVANDRKQLLVLSRERASIEETVGTYDRWMKLEEEKASLNEMNEASDASDLEMREMIRNELKAISVQQEELENAITLMLLPKDPNDDRNVMLEIRAGTGGDEASIFAGDLVNIYRKYSELQGWKVTQISDTPGEMGG